MTMMNNSMPGSYMPYMPPPPPSSMAPPGMAPSSMAPPGMAPPGLMSSQGMIQSPMIHPSDMYVPQNNSMMYPNMFSLPLTTILNFEKQYYNIGANPSNEGNSENPYNYHYNVYNGRSMGFPLLSSPRSLLS